VIHGNLAWIMGIPLTQVVSGEVSASAKWCPFRSGHGGERNTGNCLQKFVMGAGCDGGNDGTRGVEVLVGVVSGRRSVARDKEPLISCATGTVHSHIGLLMSAHLSEADTHVRRFPQGSSLGSSSSGRRSTRRRELGTPCRQHGVPRPDSGERFLVPSRTAFCLTWAGLKAFEPGHLAAEW